MTQEPVLEATNVSISYAVEPPVEAVKNLSLTLIAARSLG